MTPSSGANQRSADGAAGGGARAGQAVMLADGSGGAGVDTWEWNFGDGSRGTGRQVTHTWARAGTYTVTLVVSGRYGSATVTDHRRRHADPDAARRRPVAHGARRRAPTARQPSSPSTAA